MPTKIEWATESWNPILTEDAGYHCTKISEGCQNCYAERFNKRFGNNKPFDNKPAGFVINHKQLVKPQHWKKPRLIFVQSMGDIFHPNISDSLIRKLLFHVWFNRQHTFIFLTKRPERVAGKGQCTNCGYLAPVGDEEECPNCRVTEKHMRESGFGNKVRDWPKNLWLGVTAENQARADERIPILLQIPAAVRFVSVEPMLSEINLSRYLKWPICKHWSPSKGGNEYEYGKYQWKKQSLVGAGWAGLDQVICGGETGPGARPMHPDWVRSLRDQCQASGTPFFFKSWGDWQNGSAYNTNAKHLTVLYNGETIEPGQELSITLRKDWQYLRPCKMARVGKKKAGRLLDGLEYSEYPEVMS